MRYSTLLLLIPFLFVACTSTNSFTQRKYLAGHFKQTHSNVQSTVSETATPEKIIPEHAWVAQEAAVSESVPTVDSTENKHTPAQVHQPIIALNEGIAQPTDSSRQEKRAARKTSRQTDVYQSEMSVYLGIRSIVNGLVFLLMGFWFANGAHPFTNNLVLKVLLLLFIIPFYLLLGAFGIIGSIVGAVFAGSVKSRHKRKEEYPERNKSTLGLILSIIGFLITLFSAVLIPNIVFW